jgi:hypothetical protein
LVETLQAAAAGIPAPAVAETTKPESKGKTMNTFQLVARELAGAFVVGKRPDGEEFYKLRDGVAGWVKKIPRAVHEAADGPDPRLPSDWLYGLMDNAANFITDHETAESARDAAADFADGNCDVYTAQLFAWSADNARNRELCDAAVAEYGQPADGFDTASVERFLRMGQYLGAERVALAMIDAVETESAARVE